ncbi:MAG: hypothetical protein ACE5HE_12350 [Phycisphaerae bacterium]
MGKVTSLDHIVEDALLTLRGILRCSTMLGNDYERAIRATENIETAWRTMRTGMDATGMEAGVVRGTPEHKP